VATTLDSKRLKIVETGLWYTGWLNLFFVHLLYPCVFLTSPCVFNLLFYPSYLFFVRLCVPFCAPACSFSNFSEFIFYVFFPYCTRRLPIIPLSFLSIFSLPIVLLSSLSYFFPLCRTFFLSVYFFFSMFRDLPVHIHRVQ